MQPVPVVPFRGPRREPPLLGFHSMCVVVTDKATFVEIMKRERVSDPMRHMPVGNYSPRFDLDSVPMLNNKNDAIHG